MIGLPANPPNDWRAHSNNRELWPGQFGFEKGLITAARIGANIEGFRREGVHAYEGVRELGLFLGDLSNPFSSQGRRAHAQLGAAAIGGGRYAANGVREPMKVVSDVAKLSRRIRTDLDPSASPRAKTLPREMARNAKVGLNQGKAAFNVASLAAAGPGSKAAAEFRGFTPRPGVLDLIARGHPPRDAVALTRLYDRFGHHWIPRSVARRLGLPNWLIESDLNRSLRPGANYFEAYVDHFRNDPSAYGFNLPRWAESNGWSGIREGLEKRHPVVGAILGMPPELKRRAVGGAGSAAVAGGAVHTFKGKEKEKGP